MFLWQLLAVLATCLSWTLAVEHPETWGEDPDQSNIDNGLCIPIRCDESGIPPHKCTKMCAQRSYVPTCNTAGHFCLCQRLVGNKVELVSPDEVMEQPPPKVLEQSPDQDMDQPPTEDDDVQEENIQTFSIFTVFIPLKNLFNYESSNELSQASLTSEPVATEEVYETVNVHDGKLFWEFRYILTGLFLLMVGLVVYELILCRMQNSRVSADDQLKFKNVI